MSGSDALSGDSSGGGAEEAPVPDAVDQVDPVLLAAAAETRAAPASQAEAADLEDKYDRMMRLAGLLDDTGEQMRRRARLGTDVLHDPAFTDSAVLSRATAEAAEAAIRAATTGKSGLVARSIELDADALVLRATVLTYRWIDELQLAAAKTLGSIAARAIGYLAPQVALGGAVVSAGLIETDALDRDGVAAYLGELAEANPELMDHVTSGGGGLLDGLQMRSLLTAGVLAGDQDDQGGEVARVGLQTIGVDPLATGFGAALRDGAGALVDSISSEPVPADLAGSTAPRNLAALMGELARTETSVAVRRVGTGRYIAYLAGADAGRGRRLRLVGGDASAYVSHVLRSISAAVAADTDADADGPTEAGRTGSDGARVMLVGAGQGGVSAAEVAALVVDHDVDFTIEQVVTAGAPSAHVPRLPDHTRILSLEDRSDPAALLGSLLNAGVANRVTVVFDGPNSPDATDGTDPAGSESASGGSPNRFAMAGARAADEASHPDLRAEIDRMRRLGFLTG